KGVEAVVLDALSKRKESRPSAAELAERFAEAVGRDLSEPQSGIHPMLEVGDEGADDDAPTVEIGDG
ncbi:MAG: hypothetical protein AAGM22_19485, partial [Acidobacteriota bacterium]